jgi:hypothetical protein
MRAKTAEFREKARAGSGAGIFRKTWFSIGPASVLRRCAFPDVAENRRNSDFWPAKRRPENKAAEMSPFFRFLSVFGAVLGTENGPEIGKKRSKKRTENRGRKKQEKGE